MKISSPSPSPICLDAEAEHDASVRHEYEELTGLRASVDSLCEGTTPCRGDKFEPLDLSDAPTIDSGLPPELWIIVQSTPANFTPQYFLDVSRNLLENPNLTASHLARAELSYTSFTDASFNASAQHPHELGSIIRHLRPNHQPRLIPGGIPGYELEWTVVRKLIPRNPKLDKPMIQSCHLFTSIGPVTFTFKDGSNKTLQAERYLVIYLPHVLDPDEMPFYHPKAQGVAILYTYQPTVAAEGPAGTLSLYYNLFQGKELDNKLERTALRMLEIIHRHSRGRMAGYQKRVHHDVIIPQKTFQDTYTYLKGKYAKHLMENWVEQTPAQKHVFEDLGIAAFLIELWTDMYGGKREDTSPGASNSLDLKAIELNNEEIEIQTENNRRKKAQQMFPGFVDIGCGNGILVWILHQEGWQGWGFDARRRKTWDMLESDLGASKLQEMLLIPEVLNVSGNQEDVASPSDATSHNGIFPTGTFIISNHADELTTWTPILAFLSESPFIAIPCCSHNFAGTRFRAPYYPHYFDQPSPHPPSHSASTTSSTAPTPSTNNSKSGKQPSAYASLCSYIAHLTSAVSYKPEKEHLRIPSTRNIAIVGREKRANEKEQVVGNLEDRLEFVRSVVEREMIDYEGVGQVRLAWLKCGGKLVKEGKGGH